MPKRKICVVSGGRADYGLLKPVMSSIKESEEFELQIIVTGSHLSEKFGNTYQVVETDGFLIDKKISILQASDTAVDVAMSMGVMVSEAAKSLIDLSPDLVLVLGDRYEILAAVNAALIMNIPVAHICGGDVTEGAFDESIRHSITKCSHIHFVTNEDSVRRVRQMGENPDYIFNVGSPGLDNIMQKNDWMSQEEWLKAVDLKSSYRRYFLVTFHPVTLDKEPSNVQFESVLDALSTYKDVGIIITGSNADTEGRTLMNAAIEFSNNRDNVVFHVSLGMERYLNTMRHVDVVIGNSSSGLYEAPSFNAPTVNIGNRQKGRLQASSVINCEADKVQITASIEKALSMDLNDVKNPYGDGKASARIVAYLEKIKDFKSLLQKPFFELSHAKS